jgi:iron complex outermembrane recepter protein
MMATHPRRCATPTFLTSGTTALALGLAVLGLGGLGTAAAAATNDERTVVVTGTVRTAAGRPLAGVTVRVEGLTLATETDASGAYRLVLAPGERTLAVTHPACLPSQSTLTLTGPSQEVSFVLEPLHRVSEEVVVQAVRADALAPVSKTDIDAEELSRLNFGQEMPVLLQRTPSLTQYSETGSGAGYTYLYLRGIQHTRVNMTLDGVPLNEPEDSAVYFVDFGDFASALSSVQVQRGVGTSTVGAAAYAGSINFASADLSERRELTGTFGAGSFGTSRASLAAQSGRVGPGLAFFARGSYQSTDGFRDHSGVTQRGGFFGASHQGERSFLKLSGFVGHETTELAFLAVERDVLATDLRQNPLSPEERDRFGESFLQAQYTRALDPASTLTLQGYTVGAGGWYRLAVAGTESDFDQYGLDWRFSGARLSYRHASGRTSLILGAHAYAHESRHTRDRIGGERAYENRGHKNEANAFAKLNEDLGRLHAYADAQVRWARFRYEGDVPLGSVDWTFFNPKLGARYDLATGFGLYGSIGQTTREPARSDMLAGEDNASVAYDLEAVKPERVTDYELGLDWRRSNLTLAANVYAMEFRHEIALTGELSEIGLPLRRNVDRSHRRGVELDLSWRLRPDLRLSATANLSRNRIGAWTQFYDVYDGDGNWIDSVSRVHQDVVPLLTPSALFQAGLDWSPRPWLALGLSGRHVARAFLDNTGDATFTTPAFTNVDATLRLDLAGRLHKGHPTLRVLLANLLDNRELFASGYSYRYFTRETSGAEAPGGTSYFYPLATRSVIVLLDIKL